MFNAKVKIVFSSSSTILAIDEFDFPYSDPTTLAS